MKIPLIIGLAALVVVLGMGMVVTNFTSYLGEDPATCNNCHVMSSAYENWYHASHHEHATCIECHAPDPLVPRYLFKGYSGFNHVRHFTLGTIPDPIRAKPLTDTIVQDNCIRCHKDTVENVADGQMGAGRYCFECHRSVGHGARGITTQPYQDTYLYPSDFEASEKKETSK